MHTHAHVHEVIQKCIASTWSIDRPVTIFSLEIHIRSNAKELGPTNNATDSEAERCILQRVHHHFIVAKTYLSYLILLLMSI